MVHWFKRHPQHLAKESEALSNDPNYRETITFRDNLFLSHGNILVRLDKTYRFPILIVYPESTPYELPSIYPLKTELTKEQVQFLASSKFEDVLPTISQYVQYYYHLRHQNQGGNLCILEWDNLDDGSKFYGISTILKRIKDWFRGTKTGEFPPDSQEVEFYAHFNKVANDIKFLYPESFLNESIIAGESYSLLFRYLPKGSYNRYDQWIYFGSLLTGISKAGLYDQLEYNLNGFFYEEGITNAIDLLEKKEILNRFIKQGRLLRSSWFHINEEPSPFKNFSELLSLIGEGDEALAVKRMLPYFTNEITEKPNFLFVAIRFPNRKSELEFQLFKVYKKADPHGGLIGVSKEEAFKYFLDSYEVVEAIKCEKFSDQTFHLRNSGRADRLTLKEKTLNIIGVGALGSEIADSLGKAGIGTICLLDNQLMKSSNPVRHLAGLDNTGVAKVEAVAEIIRNHNPFVNLQVSGRDINSVDLNELLTDDSVSISSIADDNVEAFINERAIISNKVVYYSRALRGAKAARIFRVIPGTDACFHCLELYKRENTELVTIPDDLNLPTLKNECNNPIRPASAADLKLIAALTSRIVLDELQQGFGEANHWIWSSEKIELLEPFRLHPQVISPHPKCYYCNHEKKSKVVLPESILTEMQALIATNPKIETGGVLAGFINETGDIVVTNASGPGPKAEKSSTYFKKDIVYCQQFLDDLFINSNKQIVYIGEWHSHPNEKNQPSGTDIKSLEDVAVQKEYLTDMPAMIIFSNNGTPSVTVHPAGKRFYFTNLVTKDNSYK